MEPNDIRVEDERGGSKIACIASPSYLDLPVPYVGASVATRDFVSQARRHFDKASMVVLEHQSGDTRTPWAGFGTRVDPANWMAEDLHSNASRVLALHFPGTPDMSPGLALRRPEIPVFPITSMIHAVSYKDMMTSLLLRLFMARTYACDAIICSSACAKAAVAAQIEWVHENLARRGFRGQPAVRLPVIPLGVDCERFRPRDKAGCRFDLGLPQDRRIVLWAGRMRFMDKADLLPKVDPHCQDNSRAELKL